MRGHTSSSGTNVSILHPRKAGGRGEHFPTTSSPPERKATRCLCMNLVDPIKTAQEVYACTPFWGLRDTPIPPSRPGQQDTGVQTWKEVPEKETWRSSGLKVLFPTFSQEARLMGPQESDVPHARLRVRRLWELGGPARSRSPSGQVFSRAGPCMLLDEAGKYISTLRPGRGN